MHFSKILSLLVLAGFSKAARPVTSEIQPAPDNEIQPVEIELVSIPLDDTATPTVAQAAVIESAGPIGPPTRQIYPAGVRPPRYFRYKVPNSNVTLDFNQSPTLPGDWAKNFQKVFRVAQEIAFDHAEERENPVGHSITSSVRVPGGLLRLEIGQGKWPTDLTRQQFTWGTVMKTLIGLYSVHLAYPSASLTADIIVTPGSGSRANRATRIAVARVYFQQDDERSPPVAATS